MKTRFTAEQIIGFLKEAYTEVPVKDLARRQGFSEASFYLWRKKFAGMDVSTRSTLEACKQRTFA